MISIRLSLVGAHVDWITKTSFPRTFSLISIVVSPSENLDTNAFPSGIPSLLATFAANAGLALPVNIIKLLSDMTPLRLSRYQVKSHITSTSPVMSPADTISLQIRLAAGAVKHMAGEEGFEPSHAGIKTLCLNQLGDSPVEFIPIYYNRA